MVNMIDDILVYGATQEEHDKRLIQVLQHLQDANLTLNFEKCRFCMDKVKFLGQMLDKQGVHAKPEKVVAIVDMPTPSNVGDVRRFLGVVNQMSKFVRNLAQ